VTFVCGKGQRSLAKISAPVELSARTYQEASDSGVTLESRKHQETPAKSVRGTGGKKMRDRCAETQYVTLLNRSVCFFVGHLNFLPNVQALAPLGRGRRFERIVKVGVGKRQVRHISLSGCPAAPCSALVAGAIIVLAAA
jgi:hypothetical protein